ncbi:glycosyltransferase family 39 protein [Candidatus Babeliales bacterium]|nr:glycosyltransferase family 39 protein [Candidatus Babeliales bacterium]
MINPIHKVFSKNKIALVIFFLLLIALRLVYVFTVPLRGDEKEFIAVAEEIKFGANSYIPLKHSLIKHPLLSVYAIKVGMIFFGRNYFGFRFFSFLAGILTLIIIFQFIKKEKGERVAVWGLILLGFNQYHIGRSGFSTTSSLLLLFSIISMYLFWYGIENKKKYLFVLSGISLSFGFYVKEAVLGLLFCFLIFYFLYLIEKKIKWTLIFYALTPFIILTSVYTIKFFTKGSLIRLFDKNFLWNLQLNLSGLKFYLIRAIELFKGVDYKNFISWEIPTMSLIGGVILLAGSFYAIYKFRDKITFFMGTIFITYIFLVSILQRAQFYWPEISLIPAVFLASCSIARISKAKNIFIILIALILFVNSVVFIINTSFLYPPRRYSNFVDYDIDLMKWYYETGKIKMAIKEAEEALTICSNEVRILNLMGVFQASQGNLEKAKYYFKKSLFFNENFDPAKKNLEIIQSMNLKKRYEY